jgi:Na+-transporting methylmalonyl-CoA/oxaloacetate decarboxylase gamma subunit
MSAGLIITLQITVLGMGLVFGAIMLLWGVIALLMRVTSERGRPDLQTEDLYPNTFEKIEERDQKRRAALAAVAVALVIDREAPHVFPLPQTALVSAWQAVMRASNIRNRGSAR